MLATNQPHQLDFAVSDRLDEIVRFDLPGREERLKILSLYVDRYILNPVTSMWFIGRRRYKENGSLSCISFSLFLAEKLDLAILTWKKKLAI